MPIPPISFDEPRGMRRTTSGTRRILDEIQEVSPRSRGYLHSLQNSPTIQGGRRLLLIVPVTKRLPMQVVLVPTGGAHKLGRNLEKVRPLDEQLIDTARDSPLHTSGLRPRRRRKETGGSHEYTHQGLASGAKRTRTHDARTRSYWASSDRGVEI